MKKLSIVAVAATAAFGTAVWAGSAAATASPTTNAVSAPHSATAQPNCAAPQPNGYARCFSIKRTDIAQPSTPNAAPSGLGPSDLQSAYALSGSGGSTVAIVDAYDDPNAETDLATYRQQYGLPECSTANGCFSKVNQTGQASNYPTADAGWAGEISLDVDAVSAVCPGCKIVLVEADSNSMADLGAAENTAAAKGSVVSNSWGGGDESDADYAKYFNHQGIAITASSGDDGFQGGSYPASSQYVMSIGGTSLSKSSSGARGWTETAWDGTGSGCSTVNDALSGAANANTGCGDKRAMNDVSAVADPNTGLAVYNTYQDSGWSVYGGTSLASPTVAGIIGLAGNAADVTPNTPYSHADALNDVTSGSNGSGCNPSQLCNAGTGWDGPTGLGTPNGTDAF